MISYQEFLDEPIPINPNYFMRREDYYKKYVGCTPKDFYEQLIKIWSGKK